MSVRNSENSVGDFISDDIRTHPFCRSVSRVEQESSLGQLSSPFSPSPHPKLRMWRSRWRNDIRPMQLGVPFPALSHSPVSWSPSPAFPNPSLPPPSTSSIFPKVKNRLYTGQVNERSPDVPTSTATGEVFTGSLDMSWFVTLSCIPLSATYRDLGGLPALGNPESRLDRTSSC